MIGVITGDLVGSTKSDTTVSYVAILETCMAIVNRNYSGTKAEVFRGDSFQISFEYPQYIIEVAIFLRAFLISQSENNNNKYDARLSIVISDNDKSEFFFGKAYVDSGRRLDKMNKNREGMVFYSDNKILNEYVKPSIYLLDALIAKLSPPQANVLRFVLEKKDTDSHRLSIDTGTTRQNVSDIISRAKIMNFVDYVVSINSIIKNQLI
ncbi:hypothetical protein RSJ44_003379 [Yersinia enterocolitica]|nr:hypothetical protein [Yersinia enterocolitica]EKN4914283.1 hypothetical protein [Yersinia enterocolitica]EKN5099338.1 hypothetical protein [Yersinia enterocolitica]ELI8406684.1 hypothetical protein [Yersinia enterocolitica]